MNASLACVSINEIMLIALAQKLERLIKSCAGDSIHRQTSCKPLMRRVLHSASLTPPAVLPHRCGIFCHRLAFNYRTQCIVTPTSIPRLWSDCKCVMTLRVLSRPLRALWDQKFVCSAYDRRTKSVGTNSILPTVSEQDLLSKIDVFVVLLCTWFLTPPSSQSRPLRVDVTQYLFRRQLQQVRHKCTFLL